MSEKKIPSYEIISYPINPPVGPNRFGAKPIVGSSYQIKSGGPWNVEFWGRTESDAIAKAKAAVDSWIEHQS